MSLSSFQSVSNKQKGYRFSIKIMIKGKIKGAFKLCNSSIFPMFNLVQNNEWVDEYRFINVASQVAYNLNKK